jgi:hypothetical protein
MASSWNRDAPLVAQATGWDGTPLATVSAGPLAAAWSPVGPGRTMGAVPAASDLMAYASVVEALFQRVTVLPLRYGCWLDREEELRQLLSRNAVPLQDSLRRVEGCVEMGLRVLPAEHDVSSPAVHRPDAPPEISATSAGAAYLHQRRKRFDDLDRKGQAFERAVQRCRQVFAGWSLETVAEAPPAGPGGFGSLCFLVSRAALDGFRQAFAQLQESSPDRLLLTGPWPPYNFVAWKTPR